MLDLIGGEPDCLGPSGAALAGGGLVSLALPHRRQALQHELHRTHITRCLPMGS